MMVSVSDVSRGGIQVLFGDPLLGFGFGLP